MVDALIAKLPAVQSREELIAITRSIDRTLRAKHYWISELVPARTTMSRTGTSSAGPRTSPTTRSRRKRPGGSIATRRPPSAWPDREPMGAYILRRVLLFIPTIIGIMAISFARRAVRSRRPDRADHRPDPGHRRFGNGAHHRAAAAISRASPIRAAPAAARSLRAIAGRRGSTPNSSSRSRCSSASTSRRSSASA